MKHSIRHLMIGTIAVLLLSGCDAVENAANKAVEDAKESASQIAKETISESLNELSKQIDDAQDNTRTWLEGEEQEQNEDDTQADETQEPRQNEA